MRAQPGTHLAHPEPPHSPERLSSLATITAAAGLWREQKRREGRAPSLAEPCLPPRPRFAHSRPLTTDRTPGHPRRRKGRSSAAQ